MVPRDTYVLLFIFIYVPVYFGLKFFIPQLNIYYYYFGTGNRSASNGTSWCFVTPPPDSIHATDEKTVDSAVSHENDLMITLKWLIVVFHFVVLIKFFCNNPAADEARAAADIRFFVGRDRDPSEFSIRIPRYDTEQYDMNARNVFRHFDDNFVDFIDRVHLGVVRNADNP